MHLGHTCFVAGLPIFIYTVYPLHTIVSKVQLLYMDKIFADGMQYAVPSDKAMAIGIVGKVSFRVEEFTKFLTEHQSNSGWVNVDIRMGKSGKPYCELNTYVSQKKPSFIEPPVTAEEIDSEETSDDAIPF